MKKDRKKICVLTATRAEYGLLKPVILKLKEEFDVHVAVTGMHLSPEFGLTYREIENDGIEIDEKLEILLSSDTPAGISKTMGLAMASFADYFARTMPDMLLVLGDRYETLAVCCSAMNQRIPIAHMHGGEKTEGAVDESIRHAITKLSYLHFTSTEEYRRRVIQLGEHPTRVFNVGAVGIENIKSMNLLSREELEKDIGFTLGEKMALVTFHPVTLEDNSSQDQFSNLLCALDQIKDLKIIFTKANSDTNGRIINKMIDDYVSKNKEKSIAFISMGQLRYLSAMKYSDVVIGNSSSGIIEAPALKVPTVNIGDRQKGRIQAESVINCEPYKDKIYSAISKAISKEFREKTKDISSPYGDGNVSDKILQVIRKNLDTGLDIKKSFYDITF
jgi:GDP/UDP-N,N'-diacetylbacillosamine 2-epimerase (hydrolysing)